MKKIKWIIFAVILILVGIVVYKLFIDGDRITTKFDREFTLKVMDYAKISDEAYVKLIGIEDDRCKESSCTREGQQVTKVIVVNDQHITYVKLGTLADNIIDLEDFDYTIELINVSDNNEEATFKLTKE